MMSKQWAKLATRELVPHFTRRPRARDPSRFSNGEQDLPTRCRSHITLPKVSERRKKREACARIKREEEEWGTLQKSTNGELVYRSTLPKLKGWGEGGEAIAYVL